MRPPRSQKTGQRPFNLAMLPRLEGLMNIETSRLILRRPTLQDVQRWLAEFGHGYKWKPCLKAAMMPRIRSEHDKTSETNA